MISEGSYENNGALLRLRLSKLKWTSMLILSSRTLKICSHVVKTSSSGSTVKNRNWSSFSKSRGGLVPRLNIILQNLRFLCNSHPSHSHLSSHSLCVYNYFFSWIDNVVTFIANTRWVDWRTLSSGASVGSGAAGHSAGAGLSTTAGQRDVSLCFYYVHTQIPPVSRVSHKHKYSFPSQGDVQNHGRLAERKTELDETVGSTQVSLVYALDKDKQQKS